MKLLAILLLVMPFCACSQTFDELIAAGDYTKAEALIRRVDSGTWKSPKNKAIFLTNAGTLDLNKGRQDLAIEKLQDAYTIFQQNNIGHTREAANCLSWLSLTYNASGKYS